jgi:hypothetical protein
MSNKFEYQTSTACSDGCGGACVEVATNVPGVVSLRDTQGQTVTYTAQEWRDFVTGVQRGEFELTA